MVEFGQLLVKRWISKTVGSQSGAVKEVITAASYPPLHPLGMLLITDNRQIPQCTMRLEMKIKEIKVFKSKGLVLAQF